MKRALTAGALVALAVLGWRAARKSSPPAVLPPRAALLREVLAARNDNDPRLDLAFQDLAPDEKRAFREEYRRLPREARNERGTVVYLLGRSLSRDEDWAFMKEAAGEPACLSLADCAHEGGASSQSPGDEVTLAYPALVALKRAEAELSKPVPADAEAARAVLAAGAASQAPAARRLARRIAERYPVSGRP
ncbi:MAG: hypothetical protein HY079_03085 [Elusimicrobia bacterium]|nr:hypothetical protein [Elusimicrobiota bacterium]